jgi:hypothetical protein
MGEPSTRRAKARSENRGELWPGALDENRRAGRAGPRARAGRRGARPGWRRTAKWEGSVTWSTPGADGRRDCRAPSAAAGQAAAALRDRPRRSAAARRSAGQSSAGPAGARDENDGTRARRAARLGPPARTGTGPQQGRRRPGPQAGPHRLGRLEDRPRIHERRGRLISAGSSFAELAEGCSETDAVMAIGADHARKSREHP